MTDHAGIICAGNWIVDLIHDIDHWPNESELARIGQQIRGIGGGAANVISALAKLDTGLPLVPMGAVGDDEQGTFIIEECKALGLPPNDLTIKPGIATAHTHVMSVAGKSRTFFYQGGANDALGLEDFPSGTFTRSSARIFYLGYLTLLGALDEVAPDGVTNAAKVLERAKRAGLTTCIDLVSMPHPRFPQIVASAAPFVDVLISNEIEAALALGTVPSTDADTLLYSARAIRDMGVQQGVVIHCVERAVWVGTGGTEHIVEIPPVPPENIASNLGAGDAFCAGLLYGLHENLPPKQSIHIATATARISLSGLTATSAILPLREICPFPENGCKGVPDL